MARVRLHDRHQLTLKRKLQKKFKQEQGIFHAPQPTTSKVSSTSTIPKKKKDNENNQFDSFNDNDIESFEDLIADIRVYTDLEQQQKAGAKANHYDAQYWQDITTITDDELAKLRKLSSQLYRDQRIDDRREGINAAVFQDVTETFKNKTPQQLEQLEQRIRTKIENEKGIDIGYWESLLSQLQAHMARARLHDRHQWTLKRKLKKIKDEQGIFHAPVSTAIQSSSTSTIPKKKKIRKIIRPNCSMMMMKLNHLKI